MRVSMLLVMVFLAASAFAQDPKEEPKKETLPQDKDGNFVLHVSNQSFAVLPVDIVVEIDGKIAVSANFAVGKQHTWVQHVFKLAAGKHKFKAISKKGDVVFEQEFEIKEKLWAALAFWSEKDKAKFTITCQDTPIHFM